MIKPGDRLNQIGKVIGQKVGKLKNKGNMFGLLLIVILLFGIGYQVYTIKNQGNPKKSNPKTNIIDLNFIQPKVISITPDEKDFQQPLYDYYIKAAYNCCAVDQFSNSVVNENALKNVIKNGVRFLDFEIYSVDGFKPVIGLSTSDKYSFKENNNDNYYLDDALQFVNKHAFVTGTNGCKNPNDPIFLHLRIKSNHKQLYNNVAKAITGSFDIDEQLLGKDFSYAFNGYNLGKIPLNTLCAGGKFPQNSKNAAMNRKAKVIVIVQTDNKDYLNTSLGELVNIESGSNFINLKESFSIKTDQNKKTIIEHNKHNITVVTPDKIPSEGNTSSLECCVPGSQNPNFKTSFGVGCQIVCMCFQNSDINLRNYNKFFDSRGTAFVLKPQSLRYKTVCIDPPKPQKKSNSFATKTVTSDYYSIKL